MIPQVLAGHYHDPLDLNKLFWGFVGNAVLKLVREAYEVKRHGGRGSDGIQWQPLAEATLAKRRGQGRFDEEILIETERILASLRPGVAERIAGHPDQVFRIVPGGVKVGTAVPYADRHQEGAEYLPARPIVPPDGLLPPAWQAPIEEAMEAGLVAVIERICAAGGIE